MDRISRLLRGLRPLQEKVLRLYFGLGCERPHSAQEIAEECGVSAQGIAGIIGAAQRRLAQEGLTASDLREAARHATEVTALRSLVGTKPVQPRHSLAPPVPCALSASKSQKCGEYSQAQGSKHLRVNQTVQGSNSIRGAKYFPLRNSLRPSG